MTVTIPTSEAQYGYVVGRVIRALGDSADPDDKPDAVAATGKVTFTPKATLGRTSDYSAFVVREKIDAPLDAQGNLVRYEGATPAGISLTVGAYRVDFTLNSGSIPGFDIEVTAAHTQAAPLDLVTAAPYVPPIGVTVQTMLVPADAVVGQVLSWSASGLDWVDMAAAAGGVSSVAGRTGAVVLSSADLTDAASLATDAELTSGLAGKANASHTHAAADITSGTIAAGRLPAASATASGIVELATTAEATTGTDATRAVTPAGLKAVADTKANSTHSHASAQVTDFTEATQDIVGAMVTGAGGTYDDAAGTITLPGGGGASWALSLPPTTTYPQATARPNGAGTTITGSLTFSPMKMLQRTYTRIGVMVETAEATAVIRLGIYARNTDGSVGSLLLDAGTISAAATGFAWATISFTPAGPDVYVAFVTQQQAGTPSMKLRSTNHNAPNNWNGLVVVNGELPGQTLVSTGVSGALPATVTPVYDWSPIAVLVMA